MTASPFFMRTLAAAVRIVMEMSWQGSLIILLALGLRGMLGGRVPARWRHALWWLVLARLLIPAFAWPHGPASLRNVAVFDRPVEQVQRLMRPAVPNHRLPHALTAPPLSLVPQGTREETTAATNVKTSARGAASAMPSLWNVAAVVWLAGTLTYGVWVLAGTLWWRGRLRSEAIPTDPAVEDTWEACCAKLNLRRPPRLRTTTLVGSPALLGWWRPQLLIPARPPVSFTARDWEHVFLHEIAHLRRRDHWAQAVQLLTLGVHWFNPLVWIGARALQADRELATDEQALRWVTPDGAWAYGETLIKSLTGDRRSATPAPGLVLGILEDGLPQLRRRLQRIAAFAPGRAWGGSALGLAAVLGLATVVLGQSPPPAPSAATLALYADLTPAEMLYAAARRDDFPVMQKALDDGADPSATGDSRREHTALTATAAEHHLDALRWLLEKGARLNDLQPGEPSTALSAALRNGWMDAADYLIAQGAECDPRVLAAAKGDTAAIDAWLTGDHPDPHLLKCAIEVAAPNGQAEIFGRLYDAILAQPGQQRWSVDNNVTTRTVARGQRAVMEELMRRDPRLSKDVLRLSTWAVQSPGMREWMIAHGRDVPEASDNEWLIEHSEHGDLPEMRELLAKKDVDVNHRGESGWTPLTKASITGRAKGIKLLLAHGADPNLARFPGTADYTPLTFAANPAAADALLAGGADLHGKTFNGQGNAMSYNLGTGGTPMVKYFLDHGLLPGQKDGESTPTLFDATTAEIAEALIKRGASVNARDERGDSALMHLVTQHWDASGGVRVLLAHGADPNFHSPNWRGTTPLFWARDAATTEALAAGGADVHAVDQDGHGLWYYLQNAENGAARLEALERHGLKLDAAKDGPRVLWEAAWGGDVGLAQRLLDEGVDANGVWYEEPGHESRENALEAAAAQGHTAVAKLLLDHGARVKNELAFAMANNHPDTARMMWEHGVRTSSPLAYAVSQGASPEELARIIDGGCPVDPPQDQGRSPLSLAAGLGKLRAVRYLMERGARLEGSTALNGAVDAGQDRVVEYLVGAGAKATPELMVSLGSNSHPYESEAPEGNFNHIARVLIDAGALNGLPDTTAGEILQATVFTRNPGGNPAILKMLFDHGVSVRTPIDLSVEANAAGNGQPVKIRTLTDLMEQNGPLEKYGWRVSPEVIATIREAARAEAADR